MCCLSSPQIVKQVETISMRVQKELVLLHRQDVAHPTGTVRWLNALGWLSSYFHVRGGSRRERRGRERRGRGEGGEGRRGSRGRKNRLYL